MAKLTESDVRNIKRLLRRGVTQTSLALMYGVSKTTVCYISKGKTCS
jgi:DNA-binding XRE family transcriptional regulator